MKRILSVVLTFVLQGRPVADLELRHSLRHAKPQCEDPPLYGDPGPGRRYRPHGFPLGSVVHLCALR